ncbi:MULTISPECIES: Crp/Fnr family transcriptional regulator [Rhizobium]|uniref:Crp/Fnr family transcriptional regulator n=1 Tax=Rhizobium TaxID=379 RepID=UPI001441E246|nr:MULTISPECIES: Crp/Fnr family transcriptional regulator [Rhizobium]MBY3380936.1 Crp/Fnr family transcriptional regulator [Rhizobium laguerreae]MBY5838529.1 Crp/Fnr family transcriptional regulator [Rhizobium leguminosarum]NKL78092.1 cyclic nucleotide-binding domain-containing protein [Rhizobium leguminosarum bv. viciae]NKM76660.1 cyclic nucleotide-binding domain-containing protein [Rhizobium leguminosarum bv. viciae]QSZ07550.1 Crp/Fnr family transcriptional regulator [Rhizobium leguminosarum
MLARNQIVRDARIFRGLDQGVAGLLQELVEVRAFQAGEAIFREGQAAAEVFYLMHGLVRLVKRELSGREADICVLEPGEMFADHLVVGGGVHPHTALAAEATEVAAFDLAGLRELALRHPPLLANLALIVSEHLLAALDCVAADRLQTASQRVANYFLSRCPAEASCFTFRLPYQKRILAGKLGLAPEALSRAFATLGGRGVDVRGRTVTVDDVNLLRTLC